jgi:hypothetical protein
VSNIKFEEEVIIEMDQDDITPHSAKSDPKGNVLLKTTIFTREYTKCTAGSTFCFVVVVVLVVLVLVVVVVGKPLIKLAGISADS